MCSQRAFVAIRRDTVDECVLCERCKRENMPNEYWTIRTATPEDTPAVLDLVHAVHGDSHPELNDDYWNWRYLYGGSLRADIVLAEHEGRPIGMQPVAIFDWQRGRQQMRGAMYTGVLTHPDHRRRGVFRSLIRASNEHAAAMGAAFCMTMPNEASLPGFQKMPEWRYPGHIPLFIKVISGSAILRPKLGGSLGRILGPLLDISRLRGGHRLNPPFSSVDTVASLDEDTDHLIEAFSEDCQGLMIRRTAAYWNWRYVAKPSHTYVTQVAKRHGELMGVIVSGVSKRAGLLVGTIVDVIAQGGEASLAGLLSLAESELRQRGAGLVTAQATSPLMRRAMGLAGFRHAPHWLVRKKFHLVYHATGNVPDNTLPMSLDDWHLVLGDSDNI